MSARAKKAAPVRAKAVYGSQIVKHRRPLRPVKCTCGAYPFPHRPYGGRCAGKAIVVNDGPRKCMGNVHRADCRPGRPRCATMRRAHVGFCTCEALPYPHRQGSRECSQSLDEACAAYNRRRQEQRMGLW